MSQEPFQPASQPYIGHVGSSPDFIHHPQPFFGQSAMGQGQMFGQSHPQFGNPSNTSFQHVPSPYGFFPHQSSYGAGPSHMVGTTTMTPPSAYYPGSSSSMPFYPPRMPFQPPQIPQTVQSHQDDDDDDDPQQQQPQTRPNLSLIHISFQRKRPFA
ncbi:hypothetical protein DEO72_LG2g1347 [Vigna unguiculata]|uniref:Uncharacterized protein n=1 Tax=Vigna unguiculata TaxID=3917 RepID=A0A4D6KWP0_VIGUN|nr:hypothetical protein DEO72_LG2g1347 [Vigna unguiculata]